MPQELRASEEKLQVASGDELKELRVETVAREQALRQELSRAREELASKEAVRQPEIDPAKDLQIAKLKEASRDVFSEEDVVKSW